MDRRLNALDEAILAALAAGPALQRRAEVLQSIPGIGPVNAASLVASMPELGTFGRSPVAALPGVVSYSRDSGQQQSRRHVRGGRREPRNALYMAALAAIRWNDLLRVFHHWLRDRAKEHEIALIAVMRKLIVLAATLLREDRLWALEPPSREVLA